MSFVELDDVDISDNGAVLLGEYIVCDSHYPRPVRIISHAHSDRMLQINESINYCKNVIATPVTRDIIGVLRGRKPSILLHLLIMKKPLNMKGRGLFFTLPVISRGRPRCCWKIERK